MTQPRVYNAALQLDRTREKRRLTGITHAAVVREAMHEFSRTHAQVFVWLAMPDHIHVLFSPRRPLKNLDQFVGRVKRMINRGLARRGMHKMQWRDGIVNHAVSWETAPAAREYILQNPVRGQLVARPELWPHAETPELLP